ncbi:hypothetical protein SELMODRAFT_410290 [Selaginella moellendorffii]|uniref:Uncharacterized protein n=1 Tax=Selaginella moellendorffii TaxID=88036 RepID=D8REA2_SELML|nr:hypothetical protein SELMODRAFT_410290 [Selaginella moellendorffii]
MAPLLLTAEQCQRNLVSVRSAIDQGAKKTTGNKADVPQASNISIGEAISSASALNLPENTSPPPSNLDIFLNPKLHVDVISTFLVTSMQTVNYVPHPATGKEAATQAKAFVDLLSNLHIFGSYMPLALLEEIQSFVATSGIEPPTIVTEELVKATTLLTSKEETMTMFVGYHFQGEESNPALYIFYGTAKMLACDHELGAKSTATPNQSIKVIFYKYEIASHLVSSMADQLAITVVPAKVLVEWINKRPAEIDT